MDTQRSPENHYVALLLPSFCDYPDAPVFLPYIGRDDSWGRVTYRELEQRLVVAQAHWRNTLAPLNLQPRDVVGFWYVFLHCLYER